MSAPSPEVLRLIDAMPLPAALLDDEARIVHVNPAGLERFGRPLDQIVGRRFGENGADEETAASAWQALREHGMAEGRMRGLLPSGAPVTVHYRLVGDVAPGLHLGTFSDVTDQVALESARSDLAAIVLASTDAIVGLDLQALVRSWNPGAERLYGYTEEEAIGRGVAQLIVPEDRAHEAMANFLTVVEGGTIEGQETVRHRKDGSSVAVSLSLAPVHDAGGRVAGISMIHRDASDRVRAQAALAESERNLRLMAENSRDAFFVFDMDRNLLYANASIEDLYGYTPDDIREQGFVEWSHPDDRQRVHDLWEGLFEGRPFREEEYRVIARDGTQKWVAGTWGPMVDEDGVQVGVQGVDRDITDRRRAEEALRRTSERYRQLVEQLPMTTYIEMLDPPSVVFMSAQAEAMTGFGQDRWLEDPELWRRQLHPDDRERAIEAWTRFMQERSTFALEYRFIAGDGSVRWFQDIAVVLQDPGGHGEQVQGIMVDVTSQRRLDDRLRESERRMRQMLEGIELLAVTTDLSGRISYVNRHFLRVTGYGEDDLLEANFEDLMVPDDPEAREEWKGFMARVATGEVPATGSGVIVTRDRRIRSVEWMNTELRDHRGKVIGLISLGQDVTERAAAQRALADAEEMHRSVVETALDAVVTADAEGRILSWNRQAEETFGWERHEAIGREAADLVVPEEDRAAHRSGLRALATGGSPSMIGRRVELVALHRDGHRFPVELAISASGAGEALRFHAFVRDITERKRTEAELQENVTVLRQAMRERQLLLSRVQGAHEEERRRIAGDIHDDSIQVMAAAAMRLSMLRRRLPEDGPVEQVAQIEDIVQQAIERLRHLLFELRPAALDREGLSAALRMYLGVMQDETGISFHVQDALAEEPSNEVRTALYRTAQEALSNVRKHANARTVNVTVEERDRGIVVRIVDDGDGFDPTVADRVAPGHLGLPAMRERTEALGGWCSVDSVPGYGTTVELWVPVAPTTAPVVRG
jgi:PAS domain S-box-containing protein